MRIFVTGASGFIGTALVKDLQANGHTVLGLARNDDSAKKLEDAGVEVHRGALDDLASLRAGAAKCDGVAHLAYIHSLGHASLAKRMRVFLGGSPTGIISRFMAMTGETDKAAIEAMGAGLAGTGKPLVIVSGIFSMKPGVLATENSPIDPKTFAPQRIPSERAVDALAKQGVRASVVRLAPTVHGDDDHGFIPMIVKTARKKNFSAYVGDGANRWPAVHVRDAARLLRLALERGTPGARYHGVAEQGIPTREIAESIGRHLNVPVKSVPRDQASKLFSFLGPFWSADAIASSAKTQEQLDWLPQERGLLEDLDRSNYFPSVPVPA